MTEPNQKLHDRIAHYHRALEVRVKAARELQFPWSSDDVNPAQREIENHWFSRAILVQIRTDTEAFIRQASLLILCAVRLIDEDEVQERKKAESEADDIAIDWTSQLFASSDKDPIEVVEKSKEALVSLEKTLRQALILRDQGVICSE